MKTEWEKQLQDDLHTLEEETGSQDIFRLAQARNTALHGKKPHHPRLIWPTMAATTASVMLAVFLVGPWSPGEQAVPLANEQLIYDESVDLYEDLDFYYWLAEETENTTG